MSTEPGSLASEGMYTKLIDRSVDEGNTDSAQSSRDAQPTLMVCSLTSGRQWNHPGPYRVATACLTAFCLLLLMVLVAISVRQNSSRAGGKGQDIVSQNSSSFSMMQKGCPNVTALTEEQKTTKKENNELMQEIEQLKAKIKQLEAGPTPKPVRCSEDWHYFNESCYFISTFGRSWRESQGYCKSNGGHLAIIHTAEEQTFLWNLLPRGHWNSYWFGISDEKLEGDWYWVDGTKLVGGFWEYGEPNNHIDEDCGYIVKTEVLTRVAIRSWYDAPCHMSLPWICEKASR
ncbi:CD209 antigen-like protein C [Brachyhypopomus gauderio]|uniref:CD209 antigen-like protein C n=1 Tax=Brachyhypopomus gauderio TaxID=698409 RepID=UPI00404216A2